jgi:molybdopterin-containing oxidoreductase family iron-sulfur binding subunit
MEKCSFCVQRIQSAKLTAKRENRSLEDGDVKTACQKACPADAIVFGDLHDKESEVTKLFHNERGFAVLEELNVKPSVRYMTKVRNI